MVPATRAPAAAPIGLRLQWADGVCVLAVEGELDVATAGLLREALGALLASGTAAVVDLAEVTFADLRGIDPVLEAMADGSARGLAVSLRNPPPSVRRIMATIPPLAAALEAGDDLAAALGAR